MDDIDLKVLKVRGLPWSATKEDIIGFFEGCEIKGGEDGIVTTLSKEGRPSGEAYVEMETQYDHDKGLTYDRKNMGTRYIEVFEVPRDEMMQHVVRKKMLQDHTNGTDGGSDTGFIRLRGLPFECKKIDILRFLVGISVCPDGIFMPLDEFGRATGDAYVKVASKGEADKAVSTKHKEKIGHRYIEVFNSSKLEFDASVAAHTDPYRLGGYAGPPPPPGPLGRPHYPPLPYGYPGPYDHPYHPPPSLPPNPPKVGRFNPLSSITRPGPYDRFGRISYGPPPSPYPPPHYGGSNPLTEILGASRRPWTSAAEERGPPLYPEERGHIGGRAGLGRLPNGLPKYRNLSRSRLDGYVVYMRGIPFSATEEDIEEFFAPLQPLQIHIIMNPEGRPSGDAEVEFATAEDAKGAMNKDKANMQHRYVELFLRRPTKSTTTYTGDGPVMLGGKSALAI